MARQQPELKNLTWTHLGKTFREYSLKVDAGSPPILWPFGFDAGVPEQIVERSDIVPGLAYGT